MIHALYEASIRRIVVNMLTEVYEEGSSDILCYPNRHSSAALTPRLAYKHVTAGGERVSSVYGFVAQQHTAALSRPIVQDTTCTFLLIIDT